MKKHLKVLFLDQSIHDGGGGRSLFYLLKHLDRSRFDPAVMLPAEQGLLPAKIEKENICPIFRIRHLHAAGPGRRYDWRWKFLDRLVSRIVYHAELLYVSFCTLPRILRQEQFDILYANNETARLVSLVAGSIAGVKVVWHVRNVSRNIVWNFLSRFAVVSRVIFISEAQRGLFRVPKSKSTVIHNGIDTHEFSARHSLKRLRSDYHIPADALVFAVAGRLLPKKGYADFLRAAVRVRKDSPANVRFVVIGGARNEAQRKHLRQLESLVSQWELSEIVIFTGFQDDIRPYLMDVDVLVIPSVWNEPFGRTAIEAMALGIPVVAYGVGGLPEIIRDGVTGRLIPARDVDGLTETCLELAHHRARILSMGRRGRDTAERYFSIAAKTAEVEKELLNI